MKKTLIIIILCLIFSAHSYASTLLFSDGFESGNISNWTYGSAGVSASTDYANTGSYSGKIDFEDARNQMLFKVVSPQPQTAIYIKFYLRVADTWANDLGVKYARLRSDVQEIQLELWFTDTTWTMDGNCFEDPGDNFFHDLANWDASGLIDSSWHKIEIYVYYNSIGSSNGIHKIWVDETLREDRSDRMFIDASCADARYDRIYLPSNMNELGDRTGYILYYDDVEIWDGMPDAESTTTIQGITIN